jgi:hypothetical protein
LVKFVNDVYNNQLNTVPKIGRCGKTFIL